MDEYGNVWPQGGLFAFSGVDGETRYAEPFVARGTADGIGWDFWLSPRLVLSVGIGGERLVQLRSPGDYCFGDCWRLTAPYGEEEGVVEGAFVDRASMTVQVRFSNLPESVAPELAANLEGRVSGDGATVYSGEGWTVAVVRRKDEQTHRFGVGISYDSEAEAAGRAWAALETDFGEVTSARMAFYRAIECPDSLSGSNRRTYYKAASVQKISFESPQLDIPHRWTAADRMPHRYLWLWDTAFHVLGLQHTRPELARDALRALFAKQQPSGKLNLAVRPGELLPVEEGCQPPLLAWSVCQLSEHTMRQDFMGEMYDGLVRYIEWFEDSRKMPNGLYGWQLRVEDDPIRGARGAESGMDNSPRFDDANAVTAVDLSSYMASEYHSLEKIAKCLDRPRDVEEWKRRRAGITVKMNELLWDDEATFYFDLDEFGEFIPVKTAAGFMPLFGQIPDRDRAEALRMHLMNPNEFWSPFPVPTVSPDEAAYSQDMWRGPTWININTLIYYGLMSYGFFQEGRRIARISLQEMVRCYMLYGCLYEYYDSSANLPPGELPRKGGCGSEGGAGFGVVRDFHWTAGLFIHLAHELD